MRCLTCHYDLSNLNGPPHRCPECGSEFDPNDPDTYAIFTPEVHKREARLFIKNIIVLLLVSMFGISLMLGASHVLDDPILVSILIAAGAISIVDVFMAWQKYRRKLD